MSRQLNAATDADTLNVIPIEKQQQRISVLGKEIGSTGLNRWGGQIDDEFLRDLRGTRGMKVYREMRENDPIIGTFLTAIDLLSRKTEWTVTAVDETEPARRAANLVETSLHDMSFTWRDTLSEILSFLWYGWAWTECVYKKRDDGKIGWKKFAIRGQETL